MEFMVFQKVFIYFFGIGLIIKVFIFDRYISIVKWMREECLKKCKDFGKFVINYFFDFWYIVKSQYEMF